MQSAAISYSPSISVSTKHQKFQSYSLYRFNFSTSRKLCFINDSSLNPVDCSARLKGWFLGSRRPSKQVSVRAISVPESPDASESPKSSSARDTLVLGTLFGLWYLFNVYFNIYDKQVVIFFFFLEDNRLCLYKPFGFGAIQWIIMHTYSPLWLGPNMDLIWQFPVKKGVGCLFDNNYLKTFFFFTYHFQSQICQ